MSKVGTGELTPFKKSGTGSSTISNSTDNAHREGFLENFTYTKATKNVSKLEAFKTGPEAPGRREPMDIRAGMQPFKERSNGIPEMPPPFSKKSTQ